jgi:hypothetical protein
MKHFFTVFLLLASSSAYSANVTLDFEQFVGTVGTFESVQAGTALGNGFQINSAIDVIWLNGLGPAPIPDGTAVSIALNSNTGPSIEFGRIDGQAFDLISFQHAFGGSGDYDFSITATLAGGGLVSDLVSVTEIDSQYDTFLNSGLFNNIVNFSVSTDGTTPALALDNIAVTAVPVPAAVWLFGSALAGLGWMRRKPTA